MRMVMLKNSLLPQQALEVLAKISQFCQVVVFVHNPCQHYWADIIEDKELCIELSLIASDFLVYCG